MWRQSPLSERQKKVLLILLKLLQCGGNPHVQCLIVKRTVHMWIAICGSCCQLIVQEKGHH